jgi:3-hydroxymyristoyl/3-hydroxydecanoyl-(acyl carrier protein) dehydratase
LGVLASVQKAKFNRGLAPDEFLILHCQVRALSPHAFVVHCTGSTHTSSKTVFESAILLAQQIAPT